MNLMQKIKEKICLIKAEDHNPSSRRRSTEGDRKLAVDYYR